jgi:hypothetical protein
MAGSPLPMKPVANSVLTKWPAKGLSASVAWAVLWMLVFAVGVQELHAGADGNQIGGMFRPLPR